VPGDPHLWIDLPAREEPITFDGGGDARPPTIGLLRWAPGQRRTWRLTVALGPPARDAYGPLLRAMEHWGGRGWSPAPWVDAEEAASLAAEGLLRWHLRRDPAILIETATFDRDLAGRPIVGEDRLNMHVGWLSGTPCAAPLLAWGRRVGDAAAVEAATAVLDHIATGVSASGFLWGEWRADRGWSGGWNPSPGWVHLRTIGEATLFLGRALAAEAAHGATHPSWEDAWRANLDAIVRAADEADGRFGTYVDATSGRVMEREGTGALIWIPALLEGADRAVTMGRGDLATMWRAAARRAGEGYASDVEGERLAGAPEDIHLAPSSEDGYGALMAYTALAEREADPSTRAAWLDLARRAALWTMTFRLTHDTRWPDPSILATYGFRSRGADIASPSNQHLHAYGLVCLPDQLRLARLLDDPWLARRARDHVLAWRQLIARADGDLNARRGMVTERVYHTECFAPKGALLPLSHAWCLGLILGAALHELTHPDAFADARQ
jgi:hypothetical protein